MFLKLSKLSNFLCKSIYYFGNPTNDLKLKEFFQQKLQKTPTIFLFKVILLHFWLRFLLEACWNQKTWSISYIYIKKGEIKCKNLALCEELNMLKNFLTFWHFDIFKSRSFRKIWISSRPMVLEVQNFSIKYIFMYVLWIYRKDSEHYYYHCWLRLNFLGLTKCILGFGECCEPSSGGDGEI